MGEIVPIERVESRIYLIRGQKVMLDRDLAGLYGVATKRLNEAVKRNAARFPAEFMFQLSEREKSELVANCDHLKALKFSYQLPYAFTEHGVAMLSSVLNSERAIQVNIMIIKAFIRLSRVLAGHKELAAQVAELKKIAGRHDVEIGGIVKILKRLMEPVRTEAIGFYAREGTRRG